ncbi:MAG: trehalose-6-phosphate synthase [Elusimicrobia bacterium]|nr:trehalose-6-phosphate synthase [Elusimicrobiota bacterium]
MRVAARLILALLVGITTIMLSSHWLETRAERRRMLADVEHRSVLLAEGLREALRAPMARKDPQAIRRLLESLGRRPGIDLLAVFGPSEELLATDPPDAWPRLKGLAGQVQQVLVRGQPASTFESPSAVQPAAILLPFGDGPAASGVILLVPDTAFIDERLALRWRRASARLAVYALLILVVSLWVVRGNVSTPIEQLAAWMRQVRAGEDPPVPQSGLLAPVAREAAQLARSLTEARSAAEEEARLRQRSQSLWTAERLKEHVKGHLADRPLFVVANREPYMHVRRGKALAVLSPASGLVTGVEPVLRACGGLWLAHGAGDADRETSDAQGKLRVPPGEPQYTLKRVWLTPEEERGYYYGFSNEGLWPLCHIAHTRPFFSASDWEQYRNVNRQFADALIEELPEGSDAFVLVQDYHYALLPRFVKEARPRARVALFWHIPWPNPQAFGICPWQREILHGMLGADVVGFHVQGHCNNFLETVDSALESRVDWERFAVHREGHVTQVRPYPISIDFAAASAAPPPKASKRELLDRLGSRAELMGVGVDRIDYTKGIVERFRGIERFIETRPQYRGRLTFVQLGSPSRTAIPRYSELVSEVQREAARINERFARDGAPPISLQIKHHGHEEIAPYYRAADFCMVTSLHDGMNLVAKEFIACRTDERGSLILSQFTGAARELREALIVNPYDTEQLAEAVQTCVEMSPEEQARRMSGMRQCVKENNVYLWASRLVEDLSALPVHAPAASPDRA